jgi:hypothetical protein
MIQPVNMLILSRHIHYNDALNNLNKEKNSLDSQRQRLLDAIKHGINPAAISNEINNVQEQIDQLDVKLGYLKNNPPTQLSFDETEIRRFFASFKTAFNEATAEERKKLIRTFVRHLELDPKNKEVRVAFYPDKVVHIIGAGNGTHILCTTDKSFQVAFIYVN